MTEQIFFIAIRVCGAFLAIFFFGIQNEIPRRYLFQAGLVGAAGGLGYLLAILGGADEVMASFVSALVAAFTSHIFARIYKTPVTLFLVAGILPTVPGAGMYRTVHYILEENEAMAAQYLMQTLEIAGMIALAIFVVDTVFRAAQKGEWKQNSMKYVQKLTTPKEETKS